MPEQTGNEASHWGGGLSGISHLIMQRPQMAAMARERAMQMQLNQQHGAYYEAQAAEAAKHGGLYDAQARKYNAEADSKVANDKHTEADRQEMADAFVALQKNPKDPDAMANFWKVGGRLMAKDPSTAAKGMVVMSQMFENAQNGAPLGQTADKKYDTDQTVAGKLSVAGANNAAKEQLALKTAKDKQKLEETRLAGRQGSYDQSVETIPAQTEEVPAVEGKPAGTGLFGTGFFASPAVPAVPAKHKHGEIKRTIRTPHNAWGNTQNLPAPAAPAQPSTGINEGMQSAPTQLPQSQAAPSTDAAGTGQNSGVGDQRMISERPSAPAQDTSHGYQAGQIYPHPQLGNLKFIGGDPNDQNSWQKAD